MILRPLTSGDMESYQRLRSTALAEHPDAFGESSASFATVTVERLQASLAERIAGGGFSLGAFQDTGTLIGVVNLSVTDSEKARHRALLWGMYASPACRQQGVGHSLVSSLLERASENPTILQIHLAVVTSNIAAISLYVKHGFIIYGTDPRALLVGDTFHDEYLMLRRLA